MASRKQEEIEYYNKKAEEWLREKSEKKWQGDFEGFNTSILNSFSFCYQWLERNCKNKKVLDYGCGNGIHSVPLAKMGAEKVIGIDLSEKSLEIAREKIKKEGLEGKVEFQKWIVKKWNFRQTSSILFLTAALFLLWTLRVLSLSWLEF